jgi:diguanylate cyclase (GGDEF)-like protein
MKDIQWPVDLNQISQARLFQNVAHSRLQPLLEQFQAFALEPEEILLSPFNRNEHLYLLLDGQLKVYLDSPDSAPMATLDVGECVGEISFIDASPPSAYVIATQPSVVMRLHRESLLDLFKQSTELMQNLLQMLCARVRQGHRSIIDSEHIANIDTLTGAFTRRWLEHVFERESIRCGFNGQPLSLLMLDVDHFKNYNDQHGHLAGDYTLCLLAHTLRSQLRPKDSLARYGGEEFIILLPEIDLEEARGIGERLRLSLEQITSFYSPVGILPGITVSIGLAQMQPLDTQQSLIARADAALYCAKQAGRNRLHG